MTNSNLRFIPKSLGATIDRPLLIWIAPALLIVDAVLIAALSVLVVTNENVYVSVGQDPYSTLDNSQVVAIAVLNAAVDLGAAFGLLRQRHWGRHVLVFGHLVLVLVLFALGVTAGTAPAVAAYNLAGSVIVVGLLFWYFYVRSSIRMYYRRLQTKSA